MTDFQQLVYTRLQSLPRDFVISAGDFGDITKDEALSHVKANDEIGQIIIAIDREYFNALKSEDLYAYLGN